MNQDSIFVYGGLIAPSERWAEFSSRWRDCLVAPPSIAYFKFWEAIHAVGQFDRIKRESIRKKVRELAALVVEHALAGFHCSVDLETFASTHSANPEPFNRPHVFAALYGLMGVATDVYGRGFTDTQFEVTFDEQSAIADAVRTSYARIHALARVLFQPEAAILPVEPHFQSDTKNMPLQAADMLAGVLRRVGSKRIARVNEPNEIAAEIDQALDRLPLSEGSISLNESALRRSWTSWERARQRYAQIASDQREVLFTDAARIQRLFATDDGGVGGGEIM